jgi:RNA-directed DNA polymerase
MSRSLRLARAIANAFLDGPWERDAMFERCGHVFGKRRSWMGALARIAHRHFPRAPSDSRDLLARFLIAQKSFASVLRDRLQVVAPAHPTPGMGRARWPVPAAATIDELATVLSVSRDELDALADRRGIAEHYAYRWISKASGGRRLIEQPRARLKALQRAVLARILEAIPPHERAHGFRRERSPLTFARPHVGRSVVVRIDLASFFTSVFAGRVYGIFRSAGYPEEVARTLTAICTHRTPSAISNDVQLRTPHLPQGAPTSPALANLAAFRLDVRLAALSGEYTRYADDLAFSGDRPVSIELVEQIVREEGFAMHPRKTRVQRRAQRQRLAGIVVNEKPSIARSDFDRLKAILHNCARFGPASQNRSGHGDFRAHLLGRVAWVAHVDPRRGERLRAMCERIDWGA